MEKRSIVSGYSNPLRLGDTFTIEGFCVGSKGQMLVDGVNIKTRRKCKPVRLALLTMSEVTPESVRIDGK